MTDTYPAFILVPVGFETQKVKGHWHIFQQIFLGKALGGSSLNGRAKVKEYFRHNLIEEKNKNAESFYPGGLAKEKKIAKMFFQVTFFNLEWLRPSKGNIHNFTLGH